MGDEVEPPIWNEPPWLAGLNDLREVLEGIRIAIERPERFTSEQLTELADELRNAAVRYGVFEPLE